MYATVLNVKPDQLKKLLREHDAWEIGQYTVEVEMYDITTAKIFVPPIYHSHQFTKLFDLLESYLRTGKSLADQNSYLYITRQNDIHKLVFISPPNKTSVTLDLTQEQYLHLYKAFIAGGMEKVQGTKRELSIYLFEPYQTLYTICHWMRIGSFVTINSPTEEILIESLALINVSIDKSKNLSFREACEYYKVPTV